MEDNMKEVRYDKYCNRCKYDSTEKGEPCNECLEVFAREGTEKPLNFEES